MPASAAGYNMADCPDAAARIALCRQDRARPVCWPEDSRGQLRAPFSDIIPRKFAPRVVSLTSHNHKFFLLGRLGKVAPRAPCPLMVMW